MSDEKQKQPNVIVAAFGMLFDWLGAKPEEKEASIFSLLPSGEPTTTDAVVRCSTCTHPIVNGACGCKPEVIEAEGREV